METLNGIDIINPITQTIKMEGFMKLYKRVIENNCYDKVGSEFYEIMDNVENKITPKVKIVLEFIRHLDTLKSTKVNLGFTMDRV